ncbi:FAD-linked oxidase C-terminal domain-containing protein [Bacillus sp. DTU_2020_1000418_1_SI_GHA_SEK_038]|uniref:FAD-binding oxidoreductase n=1 Tax=Bacillus sp. DTU_2020_1000418_1_SI_GHA_SEK_038 TaxID=3077585 RepID=UPI0028F0CA9F|nr:FAD-linked oxidase C-terminal domain-containing protein [Bacillus sp. DTU_2020_1000418_1_SI_GHA_SEK_038]WNS75770.1 FAD-linked oxidase C-terminal domain-containing protein [Bacillus sp. DTU_2020_1000418_1_SI_GHA_SEK_038]
MFVQKLIECLGKDKVSRSETELFRHSHDESFHKAVEPDVVCFPESREEIEAILEIAREYKIPVTPYGVGSGLEGQAIPIKKGISINFSNMNQVVHFSPEDLLITVQPGITRMELNKVVNRHGLMFPIDPGADATIGGMVANNASGTTAVRYGSMRDQLLDLEVVLADGTVIHTGSHAKKSSSGYHLTGLFAGSEGTLGIITEITLRLHGIPEHTLAARCTFDTPEEGAKAAKTVLLSGIPVMRMELVDAESISQVNSYGGYQFPVNHSLFFEFAGTKGAVEEEAKVTEQLMRELGCGNWEAASGSKERAELWKARHEMAYAYRHIKGMANTGADVCVPISRLPELVVYARQLIDESGLTGGVLGHVGDGNFHTMIIYDPKVPGEKEKAEYTNEALALKAIEVGGTCTGEHGVGLGKMKFQEAEHGNAVIIMKQMKKMLDPEGLLNPGKIFLMD